MKTLAAAEETVVRRIVAELKGRHGPLIEVLHAIQADLGYVPEAAVAPVAEGLNLSRAEVHGSSLSTITSVVRAPAPTR